MNQEQRIAALEHDVAILRDLLVGVVGGQQALLYGLQAAITASPELRGSAEFSDYSSRRKRRYSRLPRQTKRLAPQRMADAISRS